MTVGLPIHSTASWTLSRHAVASASSTDEHLYMTFHAINRTWPAWSLIIKPMLVSPDCALKAASTLIFTHPCLGGSQFGISFVFLWTPSFLLAGDQVLTASDFFFIMTCTVSYVQQGRPVVPHKSCRSLHRCRAISMHCIIPQVPGSPKAEKKPGLFLLYLVYPICQALQ